MTPARRLIMHTAIGVAFALGACAPPDSSADLSGPGSPSAGSRGVAQAGAQDFGAFKKLIDAGKIPAPDVLDDLGFFAEHKLDYPKAACGQDICMHGLVGARGNMITGANCTIVQVGLNSPLDPETLPRPPLDLVLVLNTGRSMAGEPISFVREGLRRMVDHLDPRDRVSLVTSSDRAEVLFQAVAATESARLVARFAKLEAGGDSNFYDGVFTGFQVAKEQLSPERLARVVVLSDGIATAGLRDRGRIRALARGWARRGIGITAIGFGARFDVEAMRELAEAGGGNFYFVDQPRSAVEVFQEEVKTAFVPLAVDVRIQFTPSSGYVVRGVYGTRGWHGGRRGGAVDTPAVYLAKRTSATAPIQEGRRGGGGAILIELVPQDDESQDPSVGNLALDWRHPVTGKGASSDVPISIPQGPGNVPSQGYFSGPTVEKGFVMLNVFAGFQLATQFAADGDAGAAQGVLLALKPQVERWLMVRNDPDIADDLTYVDNYLKNLKRMANQTSIQTPILTPPEPWPRD